MAGAVTRCSMMRDYRAFPRKYMYVALARGLAGAHRFGTRQLGSKSGPRVIEEQAPEGSDAPSGSELLPERGRPPVHAEYVVVRWFTSPRSQLAQSAVPLTLHHPTPSDDPVCHHRKETDSARRVRVVVRARVS